MTDLLVTLRQTLEAADESAYAIAQGAGVARSQLSRFMSGERGLSIESIQRLSDYLGYELVLRPKGRSRKAVK